MSEPTSGPVVDPAAGPKPKRGPKPPEPWTWTGAVMAIAVVLVGALGVMGADLLWAVALGDQIIRTGRVPEGIPFASAPTHGWHNPFALAEVLLAALHRLGNGALLATLVVAVAATLALLSLGMRKTGASDRSTALTLILVLGGGLAAFLIVRIQLFAPALFAALLLVLRKDHDAPSNRVWLAIPLLAFWANLHGTVLVGLAVAGCYLLFGLSRTRPWSSLLLAVAAVLALMATSAGISYPAYVRGALTNAAAQGNEQMWAPLSLRSPLDVLFLVSLAGVAVLYFRRRRPLWEYIVVAGLGLGTLLTARTGFWLLMFLAAPAAAALARPAASRMPRVSARGAAVVAAVAVVLGTGVAATRGEELLPGADSSAVNAVVRQAGHRPVLAEAPLVEAVAAAEGTIWVGNPLDAFRKGDQTAYLDFVAGRPGGRAALDHAEVVAVRAQEPAARLVGADPRFRQVSEAGEWLVFERVR